MNMTFFTIGFIIWLCLSMFTLFFAWQISDKFQNLFVNITFVETILWLIGTIVLK